MLCLRLIHDMHALTSQNKKCGGVNPWSICRGMPHLIPALVCMCGHHSQTSEQVLSLTSIVVFVVVVDVTNSQVNSGKRLTSDGS